MILVFYAFATLLLWFSFKSFIGGIRYLRFFQQQLAREQSAFRPFVTIIAPCRGLDEGLHENIAALFRLDHPRYEIIFGVDSEDDEAVPVIRETISRMEKPAVTAKLIVGSTATSSARKVEKMREAVLHASAASHVFVFVDSDVRPSPRWLADLVAPLAEEQVGLATGYRWFISEKPTFASEMRSVWNASIASALGPDTSSNFAWGGSMAIRRDVFERLGLRQRWRGTLSDDFAATHAMREAGLKIAFVPRALTASVGGCTFREMLEFTTRQMKITRVYMPRLWIMSFFGATVFNLVMIWALTLLITQAVGSMNFVIAAVLLSLISFFSTGKAWLRLKAARLALPAYERELRLQAWTQNTLWLLAPAVFLYNSVAALFSRRITWRGTTYELKSPTETVIIRG